MGGNQHGHRQYRRAGPDGGDPRRCLQHPARRRRSGRTRHGHRDLAGGRRVREAAWQAHGAARAPGSGAALRADGAHGYRLPRGSSFPAGQLARRRDDQRARHCRYERRAECHPPRAADLRNDGRRVARRIRRDDQFGRGNRQSCQPHADRGTGARQICRADLRTQRAARRHAGACARRDGQLFDHDHRQVGACGAQSA